MKKSLFLSLSAIMVLPLVGCNKDQKWEITRDSYDNVIEADSYLNGSQDELTLTVSSELVPFKQSLESKDIILFNADTLAPIKDDHYYSYDSYVNSKVQFKKFESNNDGRAFTLSFNGDEDTHYGVIVNKSAIVNDQYVWSKAAKTYHEQKLLVGSKSQDEIADEWASKYIKSNASYDESQDFLDMAKYYGEIIFGIISNCPTSSVDGIFGIISMFNGLRNNEPSTYDVYNKLIDIEKKLSEISEQIAENQKVLVEEDLFIEAQVDKALIELYKQNYADYITHYVEPLDAISRDYEQYHSAELANLVRLANHDSISLHYEVEDEKYHLLSKYQTNYNAPGVQIYDVNIPSYANARAFLEAHNGVVVDGFIDELYKDYENAVKVAIENNVLEETETVKAEHYKKDLYKVVLDDLEKERYEGVYGSDEYKKAQDVLNATINLANKISGKYGTDSILESVIQRIRCMFNFQKEGRRTVRSFIANIKETLEKYAAMASSACLYAKINQEELNESYQQAIKVIQAYDKINDELHDNYNFITETNIGTNFVKSIFDVSYTDPGNHCKFHKEYTWRRVDNFAYNGPTLTKLDIDNTYLVDDISHLKINNRRKILGRMGYDVKTNYVNYLAEQDESARNAKNMYDAMHFNGWVGTDGYRFLSRFDGLKELDGTEDINFKCVAKGNPGGHYFNLGSYYKYKSVEDEDYWHGAKAVGKFIDANTLDEQKNKIIAAYATYHEGHSYWFEDEYYAFQDNCNGNYFFISFAE